MQPHLRRNISGEPILTPATSSVSRVVKTIILLLAALASADAAPAEARPWWSQPFSLVSDSDPAVIAVAEPDAARELAHGGWYGIWWHDVPQIAANQNRRLEAARAAGVRTVLYFDTGELGEFIVWTNPAKEVVHTGWSLPQFRDADASGALHWFGLQQFFESPDWVNLPTAPAYDLPPMTYPDGRPADPANWYDAVAAKSLEGELARESYSNEKITDDLAARTGLDKISTPQRAESADTAGKSGWITVRLWRTDRANRQYTAYACRELADALRRHTPDAVHFDDYGGSNTISIVDAGFGEWSVAHFKDYARARFDAAALRRMGIDDLDTFDVREWFLTRPWREKFKIPAAYWQAPEWREEPIFRLYELSLVAAAREHYQQLYDTVKRVAAEQGREIAVMGNTIPIFPGEPLMRGVIDVPSFEWATYKHYGFLFEPMGLPPAGRIAPFTRLAAQFAASGFSIPATYVPREFQGESGTELHKVMQFDCLANRAVFDYGHWFLDGYSPGTPESAAFGNRFLREHRDRFADRRFLADVGLLYSPASLLAAALPGGLARPGAELFQGEYIGWADFLTRENIQWDAVLDTTMTPESLARFPLVIVPSAIALSDPQIELLERYVIRGGRLLVTGETATYDGIDGLLLPRTTHALAKLERERRAQFVSTRPGLDYHKNGRDPESAEVLHDLIAATELTPRLRSSAPDTVGLSLNLDANDHLALDIVNYDVDPTVNRITPTPEVTVTIALPEWRGATDLRVTWITTEVGKVAGEFPGTLRWDAARSEAVLTLPPIRYFAMAILEPEK